MNDVFFAGDTSGFKDIRPHQLASLDKFNCLYSFGHPKGIDNTDNFIRGGLSRTVMDILFAGEGFNDSDAFLFSDDKSRLLSYINNRQRIEKNIEVKKVMADIIRQFDLYFSGSDKWGMERIVQFIEQVLNTDKESEEMDLYLAGVQPSPRPDYFDIFNMGFNRLLSYAQKDSKELKDMDLYLVGPEKANIMDEVIDNNKSNMLFNYIDGKKVVDKLKDKFSTNKLFIDSGAFSAWTKGKEIDVDEYIKFINDRSEYIYLYGQVDCIPGDIINGATDEQVKEAAKKTWENYLYMRPKMKNPNGLLYTFHVGEPYEYLKQALEWRDEEGKPIPYIALGGMVGKPGPVKDRFLQDCFSIIKQSSNPDIKVHAFGMTSFDLLSQYPITSADSTSWIMTGANGNIMTDYGIIAVSDKGSMLPEHYSHLPDDIREEFCNNVEKYGFTLKELQESRDKRIMHNARYMQKKADELVYRPKPKKKSLI